MASTCRQRGAAWRHHLVHARSSGEGGWQTGMTTSTSTLSDGRLLELDVGLCWVLREDGKLQRAIGGTLVIDATGKGQPVVTTRPRD